MFCDYDCSVFERKFGDFFSRIRLINQYEHVYESRMRINGRKGQGNRLLHPSRRPIPRRSHRRDLRPLQGPARLPRARVRRQHQRLHLGGAPLQPAPQGARRARAGGAPRRRSRERAGRRRRRRENRHQRRDHLIEGRAQRHRTHGRRARRCRRSGPGGARAEQDDGQCGRQARLRGHRDRKGLRRVAVMSLD